MSKQPSKLELEMARQIQEAGLPEPEREFKAIPHRKFLFDFAWPEQKLTLEVQGAVFVRGAHSTGAGITRDCEKLDLALLEGYRPFQVTSVQIKNGEALEWIKRALLGNDLS